MEPVKEAAMTKWFAPKRIGYGWRPVTWQGWLITLGGAAAIAALARALR